MGTVNATGIPLAFWCSLQLFIFSMSQWHAATAAKIFSALTKFISHFHIWVFSRTADEPFSLINDLFLVQKSSICIWVRPIVPVGPAEFPLCTVLCEPWELGGSALDCLIFPILEHKEAPALRSPGYPPVYTVQKCQLCILHRLRKHRVKRKEGDFKTEEGNKPAFRLNAF